jgi:hypothetical protein
MVQDIEICYVVISFLGTGHSKGDTVILCAPHRMKSLTQKIDE